MQFATLLPKSVPRTVMFILIVQFSLDVHLVPCKISATQNIANKVYFRKIKELPLYML